jgi:Predicted phosphatases
MVKILLLSAGTNACYHFAKTLKEKFKTDFIIVGADINERYLIPTANYLDVFYKVPYSSDPNYYNTILDICKKEKIDYIFSSFDLDQQLFYPENKDLLKIGCKSLSTGASTLPIYKDKDTMNKFLNNRGFIIPILYDLKDIEEKKEYFIKPKNGVGSNGAKKLIGKEIKTIKNIKDFLVQEVCSEPEYTIECFNYNNECRTIVRQRIATKAGVCVKTKIFNQSELENIAKNFAHTIKCPCYFNVQVMKNSKGNFAITDINLRSAGGMSLAFAAGWDVVSAIAKIMLGKKEKDIFKTLPKKIPTQYVIRAYTDIITKTEKQITAFDLDGTLLDSRKRHQIVLNDILKKYKIKLNTKDLIAYKREGKNNIDYLLSKGIAENLAKKIQKEWIENIEREKYLIHDKLYRDTFSLLKKYKDFDRILLTARNNKKGLLKQLKTLKLMPYFKEICVVPTGKEASNNKARILKEKNAILMIGDTLSDYIASQKAGIDFVYHKNGFHSEKIIGR